MHRVVVFDRENNHSNVVVCFIFGTLLFDEYDEYDITFSRERKSNASHTKNGIQQHKQFTKTIVRGGYR